MRQLVLAAPGNMLTNSEQQLAAAVVVGSLGLFISARWLCARERKQMNGKKTPAAAEQAVVLTDVHAGLPPPPTAHCAMVTRSYAYHHYAGPPDHFNDCGWGCAYRSCQTLLSSLLGTEAQIPTVNQLQSTLVEIGDKPPRFHGSRDWIGSTEVGLLVQQLAGHEFRILMLAEHESIASKVGSFAEHFRR